MSFGWKTLESTPFFPTTLSQFCDLSLALAENETSNPVVACVFLLFLESLATEFRGSKLSARGSTIREGILCHGVSRIKPAVIQNSGPQNNFLPRRFVEKGRAKS